MFSQLNKTEGLWLLVLLLLVLTMEALFMWTVLGKLDTLITRPHPPILRQDNGRCADGTVSEIEAPEFVLAHPFIGTPYCHRDRLTFAWSCEVVEEGFTMSAWGY